MGTLARSRYGGPGARPVVGAYKQQVAAPQAAYGSTYAPRSYNATAGYNAGGQNFTIKAVSTPCKRCLHSKPCLLPSPLGMAALMSTQQLTCWALCI